MNSTNRFKRRLTNQPCPPRKALNGPEASEVSDIDDRRIQKRVKTESSPSPPPPHASGGPPKEPTEDLNFRDQALGAWERFKTPKYFKVCIGDPRPWKKHKVWDADGFLKVSIDKVVLYDDSFMWVGTAKKAPLVLAKIRKNFEMDVAKYDVQIGDEITEQAFREGLRLGGEPRETD